MLSPAFLIRYVSIVGDSKHFSKNGDRIEEILRNIDIAVRTTTIVKDLTVLPHNHVCVQTA